MGQFKPMVKMMTDEPSVILKLKKGGKVHHKSHKEHEEHGHKPMHKAMGSAVNMPAEMGMAPMRPSMMARRKAMNPMLYKKGGDVKAELHKVEKELKHHEHEKASKAHHGLKHGGKVHHKSGHPEGSMEHHKAMAKHYEKMCKEGGSAHAHKMLKHHKAMCAGGKYASGGAIDKDETRTTIEGNAKKFEKTKVVDGQHHDKHHGTGAIKEGKPAGYKHGGHAHKHHKATGGAIPADTHEKKNVGKVKMHGTIEGNEHDYLSTEMHSAKRDKAHGTGGIKETNAGGFKRGGKVAGIGRAIEGGNWENRPADTSHGGKQNGTTGGVRESNAGGFKHGGHAAKKHYATGGNVISDGKAVKMPRHFVSRPVANSLQSGTFAKGGEVKKKEDKPNLRLIKTHTGPKGHVAKVYKDRDWEEYRTKFYTPEGKHLTEGDSHTDDLEDAHMTAKHEVNRGYAKGGKAKKYAEGASVTPSGDPKVVTDKASRELEEALNPLSMAKEGYQKIKDYFTSKPAPAGSVTKTEKSVTVSPRKRGGRA
jgi:hypothetical protein